MASVTRMPAQRIGTQIYTHTPTQAHSVREREGHTHRQRRQVGTFRHANTHRHRESESLTYTDRAVKWEHAHTRTQHVSPRATCCRAGALLLACPLTHSHTHTVSLSRFARLPVGRLSERERESKAKSDTHSHRLVVVVPTSPQHIDFAAANNSGDDSLTALHKVFVLRRVRILSPSPSPSLPLLVCVFLCFSPLRLSVAHEIRRSNAEKQR